MHLFHASMKTISLKKLNNNTKKAKLLFAQMWVNWDPLFPRLWFGGPELQGCVANIANRPGGDYCCRGSKRYTAKVLI